MGLDKLKNKISFLPKKYFRIVFGLSTYIPGFIWLYNRLYKYLFPGTISVRYCYSVWMRHLVYINQFKHGIPKKIAELGPGNSIGIGLAALFSGAEQYIALDVVKYAHTQHNIDVFNELLTMFKNREDIPDEKEFPRVKPYISSYKFPNHILTEEVLTISLSEDRLKKIYDAIYKGDNKQSFIKYVAPWDDINLIKQNSMDMILSQAVLEHVDNLRDTYKALYLWLNNDGVMSHQIDLSSHGNALEWNGHWAYTNFLWKMIKGKRFGFINRKPRSYHHLIPYY